MTPTPEQVIQWARDAGFQEKHWKAMTFDRGPYEVTYPSVELERIIAIAFAAGQSSGQQAEREKFDEAGYSNYLGDPVLYMDVPGGTKLYRIREEQ